MNERWLLSVSNMSSVQQFVTVTNFPPHLYFHHDVLVRWLTKCEGDSIVIVSAVGDSDVGKSSLLNWFNLYCNLPCEGHFYLRGSSGLDASKCKLTLRQCFFSPHSFFSFVSYTII